MTTVKDRITEIEGQNDYIKGSLKIIRKNTEGTLFKYLIDAGNSIIKDKFIYFTFNLSEESTPLSKKTIVAEKVSTSLKFSDIGKKDLATLTSTTETTLTNCTYTVTAGKSFFLTSLIGASNAGNTVIFRFKVAGTLELVAVTTNGTNNMTFPIPIKIATAGQQITITAQSNNTNSTKAGFRYDGFEE